MTRHEVQGLLLTALCLWLLWLRHQHRKHEAARKLLEGVDDHGQRRVS